MCTCMYVCMYVCMYLCMFECVFLKPERMSSERMSSIGGASTVLLRRVGVSKSRCSVEGDILFVVLLGHNVPY